MTHSWLECAICSPISRKLTLAIKGPVIFPISHCQSSRCLSVSYNLPGNSLEAGADAATWQWPFPSRFSRTLMIGSQVWPEFGTTLPDGSLQEQDKVRSIPVVIAALTSVTGAPLLAGLTGLKTQPPSTSFSMPPADRNQCV